MHNNIVMPTVGLADRAGVHALVRAGHERNFESLSFHEVPEAGKKERFRRNMEAIRVLKECEFENRFATPEEQEILSHDYVTINADYRS